MVGLTILENTNSFHQKVIEAICNEMNNKMFNLGYAIRDNIASNLKPIFINTKDYSLMMNDPDILAEMGLPRGTRHDIMDRILQKICDNVEVDFRRFHVIGNQIHGGFEIGIVISDYSDILSMPEAVIASKNGLNEWLDWILLRGSEIVVDKYHVKYEVNAGRSTLGIMTPKGTFTVDSRIQGTENDNWLTRALKTNRKELESLIIESAREEIERVL
jgi:hypothetical protein